MSLGKLHSWAGAEKPRGRWSAVASPSSLLPQHSESKRVLYIHTYIVLYRPAMPTATTLSDDTNAVPATGAARLRQTRITALPESAYYIPDFISPDEEAAILHQVRPSPSFHALPPNTQHIPSTDSSFSSFSRSPPRLSLAGPSSPVAGCRPILRPSRPAPTLCPPARCRAGWSSPCCRALPRSASFLGRPTEPHPTRCSLMSTNRARASCPMKMAPLTGL